MWHFVSSAPLTYSWLAVLLVTTIIQRNLTKREFHAWVVDGSTNEAAAEITPKRLRPRLVSSDPNGP